MAIQGSATDASRKVAQAGNPFLGVIGKLSDATAIEKKVTDEALAGARTALTEAIKALLEDTVARIATGEVEPEFPVVHKDLARTSNAWVAASSFEADHFKTRELHSVSRLAKTARNKPALWDRLKKEVFEPIIAELQEAGLHEPKLSLSNVYRNGHGQILSGYVANGTAISFSVKLQPSQG
jgi:hypothetical protein